MKRGFTTLPDQRLLSRGNSILGDLFSKSVHSIRQLTADESEAKGFYRFLQNDRVSQEAIIGNMVSNCRSCCADKYVLDRTVGRMDGMFQRAGIVIVRYADDFVLMAGQIPTRIEEKLNELISRMGLELNTTKTRRVNASQTSFDFLGFTMRYNKDLLGRSGRYWKIAPSKKSEKKLRENIDRYLKVHGPLSYGDNYIWNSMPNSGAGSTTLIFQR